jgi:hypothetical protein
MQIAVYFLATSLTVVLTQAKRFISAQYTPIKAVWCKDVLVCGFINTSPHSREKSTRKLKILA